MPDQSQGMWPAIWFLPGVSGTPYNELDGYEGGWIGADPNETMHSDYFSDQGQQQNAYSVGADVSAGYHLYGFHFVPGQSITAYFDGRQVWQVSASNGVTITSEPYEIIIELQVATQETSDHTVPIQTTPSASMEVAGGAGVLVAHPQLALSIVLPSARRCESPVQPRRALTPRRPPRLVVPAVFRPLPSGAWERHRLLA